VQRNDRAVTGLSTREQRLRELFSEGLRFGAVGVASAGLYFGLIWVFGALTPLVIVVEVVRRLLTRFSYSVSTLTVRATFAYGLGIIFNYLVQRSFTFRSARQHQHAGPRYMVVQLGGMAINSAVLWVGVDVEHWWYPPVQFGAIALTAIWSYFGQKFWAFERAAGE